LTRAAWQHLGLNAPAALTAQNDLFAGGEP
jgi:hypothetical protein